MKLISRSQRKLIYDMRNCESFNTLCPTGIASCSDCMILLGAREQLKADQADEVGLKSRIKDLENINEQHRIDNGKLREENYQLRIKHGDFE